MVRPADIGSKNGLLFAFLGLFLVAACGTIESPEPIDTPSGPQTTGFSCELVPSPLTVLDGGWKPGGKIMLVVSGVPSAYELPPSTTASLAVVKGNAPASSGVFVASPYGKDVEFLGTSIGATIPTLQGGKEVAGISYSAAKVTGDRVQMKDLCARLIFSVKEASFTSLKLSSTSGAKLAGKVRLTFPSGAESTLKADGTSATITLSPGQDGSITPGDYALACLSPT